MSSTDYGIDLDTVEMSLVEDTAKQNLVHYIRNELKHGEYTAPEVDKQYRMVSRQTGNDVYVRMYFPNGVDPNEQKHQQQEQQLKGVVFFAHGLNTHSGGAAHIAPVFTSQGYLMVMWDHASFGQSTGEEGLRAHVSDFSVWTKDGVQLVQETIKQYPVPFFVVGLSMGGLICTSMSKILYETESLYRGSILMAPAYIPVTLPSPPILFVFRILANCFASCLWNKQIVPRPADDKGKYDCWHPMIIENGTYDRLMKDPLRYAEGMRLSVAYSIKHKAETIMADLQSVRFPFLLQHGDKDGVIDWRGSDTFYQNCNTSNGDKKFVRYPQAYHALTIGPYTPEVLNDALSFMTDRLKLGNPLWD